MGKGNLLSQGNTKVGILAPGGGQGYLKYMEHHLREREAAAESGDINTAVTSVLLSAVLFSARLKLQFAQLKARRCTITLP